MLVMVSDGIVHCLLMLFCICDHVVNTCETNTAVLNSVKFLKPEGCQI